MKLAHAIPLAPVALALIAACGPSSTADHSLDGMTDGGTFHLVATPAPNPIPLNEAFVYAVEVHPTTGDTDGISLAFDAVMPDHNHGMNTLPEVSETGPGAFDVEGLLFHMPGDWEIRIDVSREGETERAVFPVQVD
jgi:hypothetical protein